MTAATVVHKTSLAATVDAVNEAFFLGAALPASVKRGAARWIAGRHGGRDSYAGMPAPTPRDIGGGSGSSRERMATRAGSAHILGEEACRALLLLNADDEVVRQALEVGTVSMVRRLRDSRDRETRAGREWLGAYCCARCTCALWRHFTVGGLRDADPHRWLRAGMKGLRAHRKGDGKWRRFPFDYTLLALCEMDLPEAIREMQYAAGACERLLRRPSTAGDKYERRRRIVAERVLARC